MSSPEPQSRSRQLKCLRCGVPNDQVVRLIHQGRTLGSVHRDIDRSSTYSGIGELPCATTARACVVVAASGPTRTISLTLEVAAGPGRFGFVQAMGQRTTTLRVDCRPACGASLHSENGELLIVDVVATSV